MSDPIAPVSAPSGDDAPPPEDGWRAPTPDLGALRAQLDTIDDRLHDLLIERAKVVESVARAGKRSAFRPGREAAIIRRLLARHHGALPARTIGRMWREMLAGTTAMQAPIVVAVCETEPGAPITQAAREHFGALTPIHVHTSPARALAEVSAGTAAVAVLPYPSERETWWTTLSNHIPRVHIIARLPFWAERREGAPGAPALVVAADAPDASGLDRGFLCLELKRETSRTRLMAALAAAGFAAGPIETSGPLALIDVEGFLTTDDPRLAALSEFAHPVVLGAYAEPITGDLA
jgi:chorismate mutase-like protein